MPEGPSILILKEEAMVFKGHKVLEIRGNTSIDKDRLLNKTVIDLKSWGKHLLICFKGFTVRIHLMLFGSYRINERKESEPRLGLTFNNGELNFYTCSVKFIEEDLDELYDWEVDTLSDKWKPSKALRALQQLKKNALVSDALLDQEIFAGSGNIVKCEVLYRICVHPESKVHALPPAKLKEMVEETRAYVFDFYRWKKAFVLAKHWKAYKQKTCARCGSAIALKYTGANKRRSFFCPHCQVKYTQPALL